MKYDLIISINVHEKPEYLKTQLENIKEHVKLSYKIILNCNDYMYEELQREDLDVILNPEVINKKRFHGSLTKGIYSNMKYAIDNFEFDYFLVMSSREFFYKELTSFEDIKQTSILLSNESKQETQPTKNYDIEGWHWPSFKRTKLFQYFKNNDMYFSSSAHEGLCFDYLTAKHIVTFLHNNVYLRETLFEFKKCVEEFALQSIACNYSEYYNIGNGALNKTLNKVSPNRFTHKRKR